MEMQVGFRRGGSLTSKTNCPFKALVQVKLYIKEKRRKCGFSEGDDFDEVGKLVRMLLVTDAEKVNTGSIVSIEIKKIVLIVFRK